MCEREYRNKDWLIKQFDKYKTPNEVAKATGYPRTCITRYATKYNIYSVKYNRNKSNHVNEKYFANIDTKEKAYFLGFIMADGNMYQHEDGKLQFSIKIKNTDKDILYKLANEIEFPIEKITQREEKRKGSITKCAEIKIYNQTFCSCLVKLGVVPRKTGKEYMPNIKHEFKKDFIRGFIDGDGWISKDGFQIGFASSSLKLIKSIKSYILKELNIDLTIYDEQIYTIKSYKRKNIYQMLKHFYYEGCMSLDRKYNLANIKKQEILEDLIGSL